MQNAVRVRIAALSLAGIGLVSLPAASQNPPAPNAQMKAVLNQHAALGPKPIEKLTAAQARRQPTVTDAVMALLRKRGMSTAPIPVGAVEDRQIPGPAGPMRIRVYTPKGKGPFPVVVYFHGGGWVIAGINTYDGSCRALANAAGAVVVSVDYRMAPEHKYPAAHEDSYAATQWVAANAQELNGDPKRVAVAGESAGGNLATAVCLMARDRKGKMPVHQLLVYPITNYAFDTPSYRINAKAKPLNRAMMQWFFRHYLRTPSDGKSAYVSPLRAKLRGLPRATLITAEIDPLRSEGRAYADRLQKAGVKVTYRDFTGVTHEFFGTGALVGKAKQAVNVAAAGLKTSFAR